MLFAKIQNYCGATICGQNLMNNFFNITTNFTTYFTTKFTTYFNTNFRTNFTTNHYHYPPPTIFYVPKRNTSKYFERPAKILRGLWRFGDTWAGGGVGHLVPSIVDSNSHNISEWRNFYESQYFICNNWNLLYWLFVAVFTGSGCNIPRAEAEVDLNKIIVK